MFPGLSTEETAKRGLALAQAEVIGVRQGPSRRDSETLALLFDTMERQAKPSGGFLGPTTIEWSFTDEDIPPWQMMFTVAGANAREGQDRPADLKLIVSYQDWVDIVGNRL